MSGQAPKYCIILAGGKGTRMKSSSLHKVCFPIDGRPAINRALDIYNSCGISQPILVVGKLAGQVVETVGREFSNVIYAYQAEPHGTAHAVKSALTSFNAIDDRQDVLLVAGDRIIEPSVLEKLFNLYYTQNCVLAFLSCPNPGGTSQGRVQLDASGNAVAIVECADIRQRRIFGELRILAETGKLPATRGELAELVREKFFPEGKTRQENKLFKAFGGLWEYLNSGESLPPDAAEILKLIPEEKTFFELIDSAGKPFRRFPDEADATPLLNTSVYLVKVGALKRALKQLSTGNAQQEEYLTDIMQGLIRELTDGKHKGAIKTLKVENPNFVLGYSDPAELLEVEEYIKSRQQGRIGGELPVSRWNRPIREWLELFKKIQEQPDAPEPENPRRELTALYSNDGEVIGDHISRFLPLLEYAGEKLGPDTPVMIVRSPGRVNVLGRHIDHQGGNCNLMTIGYETLMVVHPRADDQVNLYNLNKEQFGDREFKIGELVKDLPWDDWLSLVNSEKVSKTASTYGVDWSQYVQGTILRLQKKFAHTRLCGMDMVLSGNVPMAAGLSSSSSLVVGTAEAVVAANKIETFPAQMVVLCGEGEWFVGTRGGSADHAAVMLGQKGKVVKVTFFDFAVEDIVPFPEDYVLAVCDSGIKARKSDNAKDQFNHRISCYRIGFKLIRKFYPQYAPLLHHLRDVNMRTLGIPLSWIYRILLHLPENATLEELQEMLPEEDLAKLCSSHKPPADGLYPIRGVVLFGLAEMERSRLYANYLKNGKIAEIGKLMNVSHDGDRVVRFGPDWNEIPYKAPTANGYILSLMEDLESGDPERVMRAQLHLQPGDYHCSLPAIDKMVDLALRVDGVVGAQLAGAGLGGCMMVLARRDAADGLIATLTEKYYQPSGNSPGVLLCTPVAGSGVLLKDSASD